MGGRDDLFETVDALARARTVDEAGGLVLAAAARRGLKQVAYLGFGGGRASAMRPVVFCSYSEAWARRYEAQGYLAIDPVVRRGLRETVPFDWATLDAADARLRRFFGEAREHDVGRQGVSFPVRGPEGAAAMLSVTSDLPDAAWVRLAREISPDWLLLAHHFDAAVSRLVGGRGPSHDALTDRERECLLWCAAGKTNWEASEILGVSERTVRFHLESARVKLGARSTTQAVAIAIAHGLIAPG